MEDHERLAMLRAAENASAALTRKSRAGRVLFDWMGDADPDLGLPELERFEKGPVPAAAWATLRRRVEERARQAEAGTVESTDLALTRLADALDLPAVDREILAVVTSCTRDDAVGELCQSLLREAKMPRQRVLALLLGRDPAEIRAALAPDGRLVSCGLILTEGRRSSDLGLSLPDRLFRHLDRARLVDGDPVTALFPGATPPTTVWEDFDHLAHHRDLAMRVLTGALSARQAGVNILFYGPPGTGKTELSRLLAHRAGLRLVPLGEADENGEAPSDTERQADMILAQRLLGDRPDTVLLFDEMEDLLGQSAIAAMFGLRRGRSKVFLHRQLETNTLPVLWTTNDISGVDPALLRRMTLALDILPPGPRGRYRVWTRLAAERGLPLSSDTIDDLARRDGIAPALAAGALTVAGLTGGGETDLRAALEAADTALRGGRPAPPQPTGPAPFDPDLVETDLDLGKLLPRLSGTSRAISFCFDGPPGTGKSALARHIAAAMDLPVTQLRASDLLSMWVGGSEANIAVAFGEARRDGTFLIFDEADSLLAAREAAQKRWEVSQVNEMLTWMESHPLPFACTTNLADRLDPAARRRFTVSATLGPLGGDRLVRAVRLLLAPDLPEDRLHGLEGLTPGDLAALRRRRDALGEDDPGTLLRWLEAEAMAKPGAGRQAGFGRRVA